MDFPGLKSVESTKGTLLILKWGLKLSIQYFLGCKSHIYIITNPKTFLSYISSLFEQNRGGDIVVVTVFTTFICLIETLIFLSQFSSNKHHYRTQYIKKCQHQLNEIQLQNDSDIEAVLAEGQYDIPLALRLIIVLDPQILQSDHLTAPSVVVQQYLRLISYKHGGLLVALANLDEFLACPEVLYDYEPPLKPIYDVSGTAEPNGLKVILHIPSAWDSWSKIILLAKSVIFQVNSRVVLDEKVFREVSRLYSTYFEDPNSTETRSKILHHIEGPLSTPPEPPEIVPLLFHDILREAKSAL